MKRSFILLAGLPCTLASAALIDSSYIGRSDGNWGVSTNWNPTGVPDNGGNTYHAIIDPRGAVNVFLNLSLDVDRITIGIDDSLTFLNDVDLTLVSSPTTNNGLFWLNAGGNSTDLILNTPNVLFTGTGELRLQGPNARIYGVAATRRLTNDVDHLITGGGQIGINSALNLTNLGEILGNQATTLTIDLVGGTGVNFNSGLIHAASGGKISIVDTTINNQGNGLFLAENASTVDISTSHILDGVFDTAGSGVVRVTGGSTFTDPTNNGLFDVLNDVDPVIQGTTFTNTDTIRMSAGGNLTDLQLNAPDIAFTGGGTLRMIDSPNNRIYGINATRRLTNAADHTIAGSGQVGVNAAIYLTNNGLIKADQPTALTIDLTGSTGNNFNNNLILAENATLNLSDTQIDNTNGVFRAAAGGHFDLYGSTVAGGLFDNVGGFIRCVTSSTFINPTFNGAFQILNDVDPVFQGTVTNADEIQMLAGGNNTDVQLNTPFVVFTGGGVLSLSNSPNNRIFGINANRVLFNKADHTIRGAGQIGVNSATELLNLGLIEANLPTSLTIDLVGAVSQNVNQGLILANGATLNLSGTSLDNSAGILRAINGGFFDISASTVQGGLLDSDGGLVRCTGASTFIDPVFNGAFQILNDVDPVVQGVVTNVDEIQMLAGGNSTDLLLNTSEVTFTGGGILSLSNSPNNRIFGINANRRLINESDHTIRGAGQIGVNSALFLTNHGLIEANLPTSLTIDLVGNVNSNFNDGLLNAANATLNIVGTELTNTGGIIHADSGGHVDISSSLIFSGILDSTGSGAVRITGGSTLRDITNQGVLQILNDVDPVLEGTTTNNGEVQQNAGGNSTDIQINSSPTTITGSGQWILSDSPNNRIYGVNATRRLINGPEHTIRGAGQLGVNSAFNLTNQGSIIADASVGMTIDVTTDYTNEGLLHLTAGNVVIAPGTFTTSGSVVVDAGRTLTRNGAYTQTAGSSIINGTLTVDSGGSVSLSGGTFGGNGVVNSNVSNSGGNLAPGASAGDLNINGAYSQGMSAEMSVEIGGPNPGADHDQLIVSTTATLAGQLNVARINGFEPTPGQEFVILTAASRLGTFDTVFSCDPVEIVYTDTTVKVVYGDVTGIVGDLTGNGSVDGADLGLLLASWGPCIETCCDADLNEDGNVDGADLGLLLSNWS